MKNFAINLIEYLIIFDLTIFISADFKCNLHTTNSANLIESEKKLTRKRRYLIFPKSSSFVLTLTGLKAIQVKEPPNWNLDLEFDMIWPIPQDDAREVRKQLMRKPYTRLRRHKRDLYANFETALDRLGLPGKNCMLRTICEARTFLHPPGVSLIDDLLRVILSHAEYTKGKLDVYDAAYRTQRQCEIVYDCPISFLQFFLNNDLQVF